MRILPLALVGLVLAAVPVFTAEAADRPGGRQQAHSRPSGPQAVARRAAPQVAVQRSAPLRGQIGVARDQRAASAASAGCTPRRGTAHCRTARMNWTQGLPPPALTQANECPDGTMATLARGHDDIVRCMPI